MLENTTLWYALALIVFVGLVGKTVKASLVAMLDSYADKVMGEVQEAEKLKQEAHEELLVAQERKSEIDREARDLLERARAQAVDIRKKAQDDLDHLLKRREQQTKQRIDQARQGVVQEVRTAMLETAIQAVAASLESSLSSRDSKALIGAAIQDLPARLDQKHAIRRVH